MPHSLDHSGRPIAELTKNALDFGNVRGHKQCVRLAGLSSIAQGKIHGNGEGLWGGEGRFVAAGAS